MIIEQLQVPPSLISMRALRQEILSLERPDKRSSQINRSYTIKSNPTQQVIVLIAAHDYRDCAFRVAMVTSWDSRWMHVFLFPCNNALSLSQIEQIKVMRKGRPLRCSVNKQKDAI